MLLFINGAGAIYGGWNLMLQPDGSSIQLSMDWLKHTPFKNYLVPGIILFISNGLFSLFVFTTVMFNIRTASLMVMVQGAILTGWIIIQILLIQTVYFLHLILGCMGLLLIVTGILQWKSLKNNKYEKRSD